MITEHGDVPLESKQDNEMSSVTSLNDKMCPAELEKLFAEADEHRVGSRLREAWSNGRRSVRQVILKKRSGN